jgi:3-hydroxy-9,10-secoandrosta-1,3,5(10)-triene-9,17-dione monooxygenase
MSVNAVCELSGRPIARDVYLERASALLPLLRRFADEDEARRSVHPEVMTALQHAELVRILQPGRLGGAELDLRTMHQVVRIVATTSPSAAWVLMVLIAHGWILGMFDERVQDEVAADPHTILGGSLAPTGQAVSTDGGWRVTGRWSFASGIDHASWSLLGVRCGSDNPSLAGAIHVVVPAADWQISDNWFTMGLKATGSKEIVLSDVFVPSYRAMPSEALYGSDSPWARRHPTRLYVLPVRPALAYHVSAPVLGMAQQFLSDFVETTRTRDDKYTGSRKADSPGLQLRIAESELDIRAADLILDNVAERFDALSQRPHPATVEEVVDLRHCVSYAVRHCRQAVERLFAAAGANSTFNSSPLQTFFGDLTMASHHAAVDYDVNAEQFGRLRLGLPATRPLT